LLPASSFDDAIRRRALRSFVGSAGIYRYLIGPTPSMRIIVDRGHLTLEGYVSSRGDLRLANILAQSVPGVFSVTNNLQLADNIKY
ncbi:MAG: BON domain-containing protein, partial [Acidobacteriota bacterium]|nr:BON domain-containing protein [Acidobacteriota bacterium]